MRLALLLLTACSYGVPTRPDAPAAKVLRDQHWCLVARAHDERVVGCTETEELCLMAYRAIRKSGKLIGVVSVAECVEVSR